MERQITFERFKELVNKFVREYSGVDLADLPDYDYASAYEDGKGAKATARAAIRAARK